MNTKVLTIVNAEEMQSIMIEALKIINKDFLHIKEEYEQALHILRHELGDKRIEKFLEAVKRRCEIDLLFCGSCGYQANLKNFRDPIARTFMDVDFDEYLRVDVLQRMPQRQEAEAEIDAFYHSLSKIQKGLYDAVSSYLVCLELDSAKLAHYAGFMFANEMLEYTELGYVPNFSLTFRYQNFMNKWFGAGFKQWNEKMWKNA